MFKSVAGSMTEAILSVIGESTRRSGEERKTNRKISLSMAEDCIGTQSYPKVSAEFQRGLMCLRLENFGVACGPNLEVLKERAALLKDGEWGKLTAEFMEDRTGGVSGEPLLVIWRKCVSFVC